MPDASRFKLSLKNTKLKTGAVILATVSALYGCAMVPGHRPEGRPFTYTIDEAITPTQTDLPGLDGGPARAVAVVVGPDGRRDEFVANEVMLQPRGEDELNAFLERYDGTILRDGTSMLLPELAAESAPPPSSGWYLIRIDPSRSSLDDLAANMQEGGSRGLHLFSSEEAARLGALLARERLDAALRVGPNFLVLPMAVQEHPDGGGGFLDAETWEWMSEDDEPATAGIQGLSIGVVRAWRYLSSKGVPPSAGPWSPPVIAIIDSGFDLDASGTPVSASADFFPSKPFQIDLVDHDGSVGGMNTVSCGGFSCPWHGQGVFGIASAVPSNRFGSAGTAGRIAWPLLIRTDYSAYSLADGIRTAVLNGADVVNISAGGGCRVWDWICGAPPDDPYTMLESAVLLATSSRVIVVAGAGNEGIDLGTDDFIPCETPHVICVGAIDLDGNNDFNYGRPVDIWAPNDIYSTVTPDSVGQNGTSAICCFGGTSAASPFVAGVVALMKGLDPSLTPAQVVSILQDTANPSTDPRVDEGYVDAFRAVERVSPHQDPTVAMTIPTDGATVSHNREIYLHADVAGPDDGAEFHGTIVFRSDRDGMLCSGSGFVTGCQGPQLSLGTHVITATATDGFDGTASDSISVAAINQLPIARITFPADGTTAFADQTVNLRGYGFDWDEGIPETNLAWQSSIGGAIGSGKSINVTLEPGPQTITLTATDSLGLAGQDTLAIDVHPASGHPTALITSPSNNAGFSAGTPITFEGQGTDPEDGVLPGSNLAWFSSIDGTLGTGTSLTTTSLSGSGCGPTKHSITLRATDSDNHEATHAIDILVGDVC